MKQAVLSCGKEGGKEDTKESVREATRTKPVTSRTRRIIALWMPHLSIDFYRWREHHSGKEYSNQKKIPSIEEAPLVLVEKMKSALRVVAFDPQAGLVGAYKEQPLAELRALTEHIETDFIDHDQDKKDFAGLLEGLFRYSPLVAQAGFGKIFLDITGCAHLFGGEEAMVVRIITQLQRAGVTTSAAIADTPGAAYALARFGQPETIKKSDLPPAAFRLRNPGWAGEHVPAHNVSAGEGGFMIAPPGSHQQAIASLPVEALRLESQTVERLRSLGFKKIGQVSDKPRPPLAKRFGEELLRQLDRAEGRLAEAISPIAPAAEFVAMKVLAEPLATVEAALDGAETLATALEQKLEKAGMGARRMVFQLFRLDNKAFEISITLGAASRAPATINRLLRLKFEKNEGTIDPGFGFEVLRLSAFDLVPLRASQVSTLDASAVYETADLENQLINTIGSRAFALKRTLSRIPEKSQERISFLKRAATTTWALCRGGSAVHRPVTLLPSPEEIKTISLAPDGAPHRIVWRKLHYKITRATGPERLLSEWHCGDKPGFRDYYAIEDEEGRRYWVYRDGGYQDHKPAWFLHGFFA